MFCAFFLGMAHQWRKLGSRHSELLRDHNHWVRDYFLLVELSPTLYTNDLTLSSSLLPLSLIDMLMGPLNFGMLLHVSMRMSFFMSQSTSNKHVYNTLGLTCVRTLNI